MTEKDLYQHLHKAFGAFAAKPSSEVFLDMQRSGLIDAEGEPQAWDAFLAIVATNATVSRPATQFLCRKPTLGRPGRAEFPVSREYLIHEISEGKRIVTAFVDEDTKALREGEVVHVVGEKWLRSDRNQVSEDNLGTLPYFKYQNQTLKYPTVEEVRVAFSKAMPSGNPFDAQVWDSLFQGLMDPSFRVADRGISVLPSNSKRLVRIIWKFTIDELNTSSDHNLYVQSAELRERLSMASLVPSMLLNLVRKQKGVRRR